MSARLWDKGAAINEQMLRFTARDDWQLDQELLADDLEATRAHVRGLARIGVLSDDEQKSLDAELARLEVELAEGRFVLTSADEDGHSAIEQALVARVGEAGKKVHTGRSRNDQVLVATRLYQRRALGHLMDAAGAAAGELLDLAERERDTPMPGFTHLQRAVPSSVGLWASSFAEGLLESIESLRAARDLVNRSPLGAAAGYGVNLALDRDGVARDLDFAGLAQNPLGSQSSRGVHEVMVLTAAWHGCAVVRKLAWDLSLFTTSEFGFVKLPVEMTTGSSIMPQKRNPDVVELLRGACAVVQGAIAELMGVASLPSGYHRDLQLTKAPTLRGLGESLLVLRMVPTLVKGLVFDKARMAAAVSPECFATDRAVDLAKRGVPFREAYRTVAAEVEAWTKNASAPETDVGKSLRERVSPGAPGDLRLADLRDRLARAAISRKS